MPSVITTEEFLRTIWGDQIGVAELTTLPPKHLKDGGPKSFGFMYPDSTPFLVSAAQAHNSKNANVYMGVCLRREQWPQGSRGTEALALSSYVVWMDLDFKAPVGGAGHAKGVDEEAARKMLQEFMRKPSVVVKTGGGLNVYWLLKEAAVGAELIRVKKVNKALGKYFGGDTVADLARILRLPNSTNHNYQPSKVSAISYWHPEFRYTLDDFDFLPEEQVTLATQQAILGPIATASVTPGGSIAPTSLGQSIFEPRTPPNLQIPEETIQKISSLLAKIWSRGRRHSIALHVAGWFAGHQIVLESAKRVVSAASDLASGDTMDRLKDVNDTYKNFELGKEVTGRTSLEKLIDEDKDSTQAAKDSEKKIVQDIQKLLPKPARKKKDVNVEPDFEIEKIIKFDSRPARYQVCVKKEGKEYIVPCELEILTDIKRFRKAFFETSVNQFINSIKQWRWEKMISEAPVEVKLAPAEATTGGSIRASIETWLDERREKPDLGELKTFPGYNETEVFFTLEGLKNRLRDKQIKATDREITHVLRDEGWQDGRKWVGAKNPRLWYRAIANGNGHNGNGHNGNGAPHDPLPTVDLFPDKVSESETVAEVGQKDP